MPHTILIADDDPKIRKLLNVNLKSLGYDTVLAADGRSALKAFDDYTPDVVLLDWMMPIVDGLTVLRQIRAKAGTPVLMLTARDEIADRVNGLELGADDYLTKPFALEELFARIKALLRRAPASEAPLGKLSELENGPLLLNQAEIRAWVDGQELHLTGNEFKVLATLMRHVDRALTHEFLLTTVWGAPYAREVHYLRVVIARLRQKFKAFDCLPEDAIRSISGVGYVMGKIPSP